MTAEPKSAGLGGLLSSSKDEAEGPEEGDDYAEGKTAAAQAAMDAFKAGDVAALESALTDFVALCT